MQALQKIAPGFGVELRQVEVPDRLGADDVLIEVAAAGICGSDVHIYDWSGGYEHITPALPLTLGHEFSGRIAEIGTAVTSLAPGDGVVVKPSVACGQCDVCLDRQFDSCTSRQSIGIMRDGAFAPFVVAPAVNCIVLPSGVDRELAAIAEPLTIGARAVETGAVTDGDRVLIMGPGPIGQSVAVMAREAGAAEIVILGKDDEPRLASLNKMGFDTTIDLSEGTFEDQMRPHLKTGKFDIVYEATGVGATLQTGLDVLRRQGILVTCAIHAVPASFNVTQLVRQQQQIRGSATGTQATWARVLEVLEKRGDDLQAMITHRLPLSRAEEGFELARQKLASKVIITPNI